MTAVDPASASLDVARAKEGADRVRWIHGDATTLPALEVDMAVMTGNVAQVFLTDEEWLATLNHVRRALRPGGRLVFETRDPERKAWVTWNRDASYSSVDVDGEGVVESWHELTDVKGELVSFKSMVRFRRDDALLTSTSTLRFRTRDEVIDALDTAGFSVDDVRDAPDRPGREFVFIARRPEE